MNLKPPRIEKTIQVAETSRYTWVLAREWPVHPTAEYAPFYLAWSLNSLRCIRWLSK
jgi:hypothetical protein